MGEIFIKLLNMSITASWLILAVLCVRLLFRKIPKWITCLLWGVVAIRLIFPFSIESVFSLQPSAEPIRTSTMVEGEVMPYVPSIDSNLGIVENAVNPLLADTFAYSEMESVAPLQIFTGIVGGVWLCGMVGFLIFAAVSMVRLRLCVREAVNYKENIYICDAVKSTFILGIVKPRIYLPSALNEDEMDYIIAHEKAHLGRKDYLWKPVGYLLLCIYWFNPLCWIAYIMLCKDIELACDEKVIKDMSFGDKKEYSRVLLSCATQRRLVLACPLAFGEVGVKERVKSVLNYKRPAFWITIVAIAACAVLAVCFLTNPTEKKAESDNSIYGSIVSGLGDNDTYAFLVMDYDHNVMLSSDLIYDEGTEQQAAVYCDVYYYVDGEAKQLGTIMSDGTAYPITFTKDGIFAASGHKIEKYVISDERFLYLEKGVYEQFDEAGDVQYTSMTGGQESEATEQEYLEMINEYGRSQIVHFSYGAEDSVNEYCGTEDVLDGQESEENWITEEINVETRDVTHDGVADYIVTSMSYDTSYVDVNAPLNERIAQQVMYDVVCVKVYEGQNGADTYSEENLLWSQEYSRVHVGNGQLSIVQVDGKDYLLTSSLYGGQGFATWNYEVFSLRETGEKEVIDEQSVEFEMDKDNSVESYAEFKHSLEEYITGGVLIVACDIDFEQQLIRTQENLYIPQDYYSQAFVKFDNTEYLTEEGSQEFNMEEEYTEIQGEDIEKPVSETTMVDTTAVSSIVVINGNTGERETLAKGDSGYSDLLKLYTSLDFAADYEENARVGYQYSMKLLDADGNKLQSVTPYKDGVTVDGIFLKYDNTGNDAVASLNLMEYLEYICNPEKSLMEKPITEVPVNTLENVTMIMEKYKSYEGDIEIVNQSGGELATGEWYSIQRYEDGEWHRLDELIDGIWKEVEYRIPNGETAVLPTNWKTWYGELPTGEYRIVKKVYLHLDNGIDTYYLATEFEIE